MEETEGVNNIQTNDIKIRNGLCNMGCCVTWDVVIKHLLELGERFCDVRVQRT